MKKYTVGEVARLSRVSVRTLHYYDETGLVRPSARSGSGVKPGYRLYAQQDLERLQQVLFYRELGFKLQDIARTLAQPGFDRRTALMAQREELAKRAEQARALVDLMDRTIRALEKDEPMKTEQMFEGFDPAKYEDEAKDRWGRTAQYRESAKRTRQYSKDDWAEIRRESDQINRDFADAFGAGTAAADGRAMDIAERHRRHIDRWYYTCSYEIHVGLGEMYVADSRFTANYDQLRPGLAQYVCDAIRANAARMAK